MQQRPCDQRCGRQAANQVNANVPARQHGKLSFLPSTHLPYLPYLPDLSHPPYLPLRSVSGSEVGPWVHVPVNSVPAVFNTAT